MGFLIHSCHIIGVGCFICSSLLPKDNLKMAKSSLLYTNHNTTAEYVDPRSLLSCLLSCGSTICDCDSLKSVETREMIDTDLAQEIYRNLRAAEMKKRPSTNFLETVQKEIDADMRALVVEWLAELTEGFRLTSEALHLTVNYLDRYLSGNNIERDRLPLLGTACILIASKHEEGAYPLSVSEFRHIYSKEEVLQMEADVLRYLKFELTVPTINCFLRGIVHVAQGPPKLEFLADYIAELSLLDYRMLCYSPSMIAASSVFVASFVMLESTERPWSAALRDYTQYRPRELLWCVTDLHKLFCYSPTSKLPAIRNKYIKSDYMFVANICSLPWIPSKFFQDPSD